MKLSTIHSILAERALQPTRSLGQNFLHDQNLAEWIVGQLEIETGEPWLEVGPGLGALTEYALRRSENGMLIEKDDRLIPYLQERFPTLHLAGRDAADFDTRTLFHKGPVKVLGNLPYYVSSQILFNLTAEPSPFCRIVCTLQRELAERLTARAGTKEYGSPTLTIGRLWTVKYLRTLPASVFTPVPQVESAVVLLTPRPPGDLPSCDGGLFNGLVKLGFSQRRKQLRKLLADDLADWPGAMAEIGQPETTRAEELTLDQWIGLTNLATRQRTGATPAGRPHATQAQDVHGEIFDVVDAEDRPVSTATRHIVHTEKLRHRAVHIFVFNRLGEIFLQKRSRWKDVHPLKWDSSAAGHVNAGDDYEVTASREIEEELGVRADLREEARIGACAETGMEFVRLYRAAHDGPFLLPPSEIDCGGWFTCGQVEQWTEARPGDFATGFLKCWNAFRAGEAERILPK